MTPDADVPARAGAEDCLDIAGIGFVPLSG
jgi:hypothetical protein